MKVNQAPVTSSRPTQMSMAPPILVTRRARRRKNAKVAHRDLEAERHQQERNPQAQGVDEGEHGAARHGAAGGRHRQHGGQCGPDAGSPAEPEHNAEQRRPHQARLRPGRGPHDAAREGEPVEDPGEQQPEHDRQPAQDLRQQPGMPRQQVAEPAEGRPVRHEDDGEPEHEQRRPGDDAAPRRSGRGRGERRSGYRHAGPVRRHRPRRIAGAGAASRGRRAARAGHAGDEGQVAGHQRQAAGGQKGDRPGRRGHRQRQDQRTGGHELARRRS